MTDLTDAAQATAETANTNSAFAAEPPLGESYARTLLDPVKYGNDPYWSEASGLWYN